MNPPTPTLYLRDDGTLLLARDDQAVEIVLDAGQLLQLGVDALRVAVTLQPVLMPSAAAALEGTKVPEHLMPQARKAMSETAVVASQLPWMN